MDGLLLIVAVGLFLGMRHATDADHVIAVTTIISRQGDLRHAALTGLFWGIGHTLTILAVGATIVCVGLAIPVRVGLGMELSVSLMLIVLGLGSLARFIRSAPQAVARNHQGSAVVHSHPHSHGDYIHKHAHGHEPEAHPHRPDQTPLGRLDRALGRIGLYQHLRPLVVGVVHGLAGSAAVTLLVLATIPSPRWAIAYLLVFGAGTIAGMMLITLSLASAFAFAGRRRASFSHWLGFASGLTSLAFGILLAYRICFVDGLFAPLA
ncbi:MAG: high-affinity nickel-transport family protein [Terriglobales bacterium]